MNRGFEGLRRRRIWMLISAACLGSTLALVALPGSAAANWTKPSFGAVICAPGQSCPPGTPVVVSPGLSATTPATITAVLTNETTMNILGLGSANLTPPSGFTIVSASLGGTAIGACTRGTFPWISCITAAGVLELRSLNVPAGGSIQVSMGITTPPPPSSCTTATPCQWSVTGMHDYLGLPLPLNQLNLDPNTSQLGMVLSSQATCTSTKPCSATLANGGTSGSTGGSVGVTTDATATSGMFYEALDYGPHLPAADCYGVDSVHDEYISGTALETNSFTVTINTTDYPGYQAEVCATTSMQFKAKVPVPDEPEAVPDGDEWKLEPAIPVTQPDGTPGYAGLLPDCAGTGSIYKTVNPNTYPCVLSRSTTGNVHTIVASFPAGFDATLRN